MICLFLNNIVEHCNVAPLSSLPWSIWALQQAVIGQNVSIRFCIWRGLTVHRVAVLQGFFSFCEKRLKQYDIIKKHTPTCDDGSRSKAAQQSIQDTCSLQNRSVRIREPISSSLRSIPPERYVARGPRFKAGNASAVHTATFTSSHAALGESKC